MRKICCRNCKVLVSEWIEKNWARVEGSRKAEEKKKKKNWFYSIFSSKSCTLYRNRARVILKKSGKLCIMGDVWKVCRDKKVCVPGDSRTKEVMHYKSKMATSHDRGTLFSHILWYPLFKQYRNTSFTLKFPEDIYLDPLFSDPAGMS